MIRYHKNKLTSTCNKVTGNNKRNQASKLKRRQNKLETLPPDESPRRRKASRRQRALSAKNENQLESTQSDPEGREIGPRPDERQLKNERRVSGALLARRLAAASLAQDSRGAEPRIACVRAGKNQHRTLC
jgi:hypothetical protein